MAYYKESKEEGMWILDEVYDEVSYYTGITCIYTLPRIAIVQSIRIWKITFASNKAPCKVELKNILERNMLYVTCCSAPPQQKKDRNMARRCLCQEKLEDT